MVMNRKGFLLADTMLAMLIISIHILFLIQICDLAYKDIKQSEVQYDRIQNKREKQ